MKQDIKKDTLKAQLDDALRQSVDGTLLVNPEMVVKQVEAIMDEIIVKAIAVGTDYNLYRNKDDFWFSDDESEELITKKELLTKFKKDFGLI